MKPIRVRPLTTSESVHREMAEALPVYDTVRRWLEWQPNKIVEGTQPVKLLRELLETAAMFTEGNISNTELRNKIYSLLS